MFSHDFANALSSSLVPDQPIVTVKDDEFRRLDFVKNLTQTLLNNDSSHGLVIGFDAPWGYGKTSLKNMVVEQLRDDANSNVTVVEFDPGCIPIQEMLSRLYSGPLHNHCQDLVQESRLWELDTFFRLFLIFHRIVWCHHPRMPQWPRPVKYYLKDSKVCRKSLNRIRRNRQIAIRQEKLRKDLLKEKRRIIVFIDDIDRLADDEISALFRAVKSVGDFPNVIYVLLYDHHKVAEALERDARSGGYEFLEKIVQVPILIPEPSGVAVRTKLKGDLISIHNNRSSDNTLSREMSIFSVIVLAFYYYSKKSQSSSQ